MVTAYFHDKTLTFVYVHDRIGQSLLFSYSVHFLSFQITLEKINSGKNSHMDRNVHINHVTSKLSLSDMIFVSHRHHTIYDYSGMIRREA